MGCKVLNKKEIAQLEARIVNEQAVPELLLMENAGRYVAERAAAELDSGDRVLVVCGTGKNGGDGYVAARQLLNHGIKPIVWALGGTEKLSGVNLTMLNAAKSSGVEIFEINSDEDLDACQWQISFVDYLIDALTGTGLNRAIEGLMEKTVQMINAESTKVCSVDMPSGIDADTGQALGAAINADITITFFAYKPGQLIMPGRMSCGEVVVVPLCSENLLPRKSEAGELLEKRDIGFHLLPRSADAHKGNFGSAILVGGSVGMAGAPGISAYAAVRSGTGRMSVAVPKSVAEALWNFLPEAMSYPLADENGALSMDAIPEIERLLEGKSCAAIGPGLGKHAANKDIVLCMAKSGIPLVIDADGLNAVADDVDVLKDSKSPLILTPHIAEMARLLKCDKEEIKKDAVKAALNLAKRLNAVVLLKNSTSVVASPNGGISYNIAGGPQLAKGGSGDVLTGIILALLAQGLSTYNAARIGAVLLGKAAECVDKDEKAVLARDVIEALPIAFAG